MKLVTAMHLDGEKFIVNPDDLSNRKTTLVEMRDRDGRLLGNKVAMRDIQCVYHGPIHEDAWPPVEPRAPRGVQWKL